MQKSQIEARRKNALTQFSWRLLFHDGQYATTCYTDLKVFSSNNVSSITEDQNIVSLAKHSIKEYLTKSSNTQKDAIRITKIFAWKLQLAEHQKVTFCSGCEWMIHGLRTEGMMRWKKEWADWATLLFFQLSVNVFYCELSGMGTVVRKVSFSRFLFNPRHHLFLSTIKIKLSEYANIHNRTEKSMYCKMNKNWKNRKITNRRLAVS